MRRILVLLVLGAVLSPTHLRAADYCDDKYEPGESPDGKAMMMIGAMFQLALAERYCGAPHVPYSQIFVVVEEAHGCGPRTRLETKAKQVEEDGPMEFAQGKPMTPEAIARELVSPEDPNLPQAEVDRLAKAGIENELGGCDELLKASQDFQTRYRNPPKWPPEQAR